MKDKPTWTKRDWTPVRRGNIYCSPACGCGCKYSEFKKANRDVVALALNMGDGWTTRVWENGGWHYSVQSPCRRIRIHTHGRHEFTAFLGERDGAGGQYAESGKSPRTAVKNVIAVAKKSLAKIGAVLTGL